MTTPILLIAGHAVALAGGQLAAGGIGSAVGEVNVNAPPASGPAIAAAGTAAAQPVTTRGLSDKGWPEVAAVVPLPQLV